MTGTGSLQLFFTNKTNNKYSSKHPHKRGCFYILIFKEVIIIEKILFTSSVIGGWIGYLIGDWHMSLTVLAVFMGIDILTGLLKAIVTKKIDSKIGYKGFIRKAGIMLVIIIANLLDLLTGSEFLFRSMAILFYIGLESLSITENLGHIGVPLPDALTQYLKQLSERERKDGK